MPRKKGLRSTIPHEPVKVFSDYQKHWQACIPPLKCGTYEISGPDILSIQGDAPKCFIRIKEYREGRFSRHKRNWTGYIAKVAFKNYPIESITEHLITRVGQVCGLVIADSQLRIVGRQVRFLSKYFLKRGLEQLTHGYQIFQRHLDEGFVEQISVQKCESDFYTFRTVEAAVKDCFPDHWPELMTSLVRMLAFDALVGNNDRHPLNWGVIEPLLTEGKPRFSPVFDTARGLFWNVSDKKLETISRNTQQFNAYLKKSFPQIGWEQNNGKALNHFELIERIFAECPEYQCAIMQFTVNCPIEECEKMIESEFSNLMSEARLEMIQRCLRERNRILREATNTGGET